MIRNMGLITLFFAPQSTVPPDRQGFGLYLFRIIKQVQKRCPPFILAVDSPY